MGTILIVLGVLAVVVVGVLVYRNNQKKIEQDANAVSSGVKTVVNTANKVAADVKSAGK
jgi:hypothetical protein